MNLRGAVLAASLASLAVLVAGCGGGSKAPSVASLGTTSHSTTTSSASAPMSPQKETAVDDAYAACIDAHGAEARVIPGGGVGLIVTPATRGRLTSAQTACRKLLPKGGLPAPSQAQIAQRTAQMLDLATCMRAHGIAEIPGPERQREPPDHPQQRYQPTIAPVPSRPESMREGFSRRRPTAPAVTSTTAAAERPPGGISVTQGWRSFG